MSWESIERSFDSPRGRATFVGSPPWVAAVGKLWVEGRGVFSNGFFHAGGLDASQCTPPRGLPLVFVRCPDSVERGEVGLDSSPAPPDDGDGDDGVDASRDALPRWEPTPGLSPWTLEYLRREFGSGGSPSRTLSPPSAPASAAAPILCADDMADKLAPPCSDIRSHLWCQSWCLDGMICRRCGYVVSGLAMLCFRDGKQICQTYGDAEGMRRETARVELQRSLSDG